MPNWCYNRISVYADSDQVNQLKEIHDIFENHDDPFNQILPVPDFKNIPNAKGDLPILEQHKGKDGEVMFETYNFPDGKNDDRWYHWCISNWGTKWDLSELSIDYDDSEELELEFSTAWSPPEGVIAELKNRYPELSFTCFYDEPGMEAAGYYQMYHLVLTLLVETSIIKSNLVEIPMRQLTVTQNQLEYLQELVMFAYEMEVPEQKGWDIQTYDNLVDEVMK